MNTNQGARKVQQKYNILESIDKQNKMNVAKNLLGPAIGQDKGNLPRRMSVNSNASGDGTFALTGVNDLFPNKRVKANQSVNPTKDAKTALFPINNRNKSIHEYSSFGLSIDLIDKRYDRWKTTRNQGVINKHDDYNKMLNKIEQNNIKREKSFAKFIKDRNKKYKESLSKIESRRQAAKIIYDSRVKELDETAYSRYRKEMNDKRRSSEISNIQNSGINTSLASVKPIKRGVSLIRELYKQDKEKEEGYFEQLKRDYLESEEFLESYNNKIKAATDRLNNQIKRKRETLVTSNTRTNDIKLKMDKFEQEMKETRLNTYYMKHKEKKHKEEIEKKFYKSLEKQNKVQSNKEQNHYKWNEFTNKLNQKFEEKLHKLRETMRQTDIGHNISVELEKNIKRRRQQKRDFDKYKEEIIEKHLEKIRKSELIQKKKEELIEFSLLKQKEILKDSP